MSSLDIQAIVEEESDKLHSQRARDLLDAKGAILDTKNTGEHYLVSTGKHTNILFQLQAALEHRYVCEYLSLLLWKKLKRFRIMDSVTALVGPERGAPPLMWMMANYFFTQSVRVITMRKIGRDHEGIPIFEPSPFSIFGPDDVIIAMDDIFTTGATLRGLIRACDAVSTKLHEGLGTNVMFAAFGVHRAPTSWNPDLLPLPNASIIRESTELYDPILCPWCRENIPLKQI